jgi:cytochrome c biogenesis protein CcmG/thiol:disulfide interchange protein DsbE
MLYQETTDMPSTNKQSNVTSIISVVVGLGLLALLAFAFFSPEGGRPLEGDSAPDFSMTLLDGSEVSLSDLHGQVVVLNFWASWCDPCREEAPGLQEVWETYEGKGVIFLGVSHKDAEDASRAFVQEFGLTYLNGTDPRDRISRAYGITGVPETFILDAEGKIAQFYRGEVRTEELARRLAQLTGQ